MIEYAAAVLRLCAVNAICKHFRRKAGIMPDTRSRISATSVLSYLDILRLADCGPSQFFGTYLWVRIRPLFWCTSSSLAETRSRRTPTRWYERNWVCKPFPYPNRARGEFSEMTHGRLLHSARFPYSKLLYNVIRCSSVSNSVQRGWHY